MKNTKQKLARPISPGDVLRQEILDAHGIKQDELAEAMQVSRLTVSQIVNDRRSVTAEMAVRLARVTSTTAKFWLNLQLAVDLFDAEQKLSEESRALKVLRRAKSGSELFA